MSEASKLGRQSAIYALTKFAPRGIALALVPVYTTYMSPADYGDVNMAELIASLCSVFAAVGLPGVLHKLYGEPSEREAKIGTLLWTSLTSSALFMGMFFVVGPLLWQRWGVEGVSFYPMLALAVATAVANQLNTEAKQLYQAEQQTMRYAALDLGWYVLASVASVGLVIGMQDKPLGMLLGRAIAAGVFLVITLWVFARWLKHVPAWGERRMRAKSLLTLSLPLVPHQLVAFVLTASDRFFLEVLEGGDSVGIYSLAYTVGSVMSALTMATMLAWTPTFYKLAGEERREELAQTAAVQLVALNVVAIIGMALCGDVITLLINVRFHEARWISGIIIGGYLLHGHFSLFQLGLIQGGKTIRLAQVTVIAMVVNLGLNALLIPYFGGAGAAYATLLSYMVEALVVYRRAQATFGIPYEPRSILINLMWSGTVLAASLMAQGWWRIGMYVFAAAVIARMVQRAGIDVRGVWGRAQARLGR